MMGDVMKQPYVCLDCFWKGTFGDLVVLAGAAFPSCPTCESENIHPADGDTVELDEYHGDIGTKQ